MGNKIARTTQVSASEYYLHELPSSYNLVLVEVLGRGRFFKSILCKHDEGLVLVKVYFKRGDPLDLKEYERRLWEIRSIFRSVQHPHVWPFQFWLETDKAAYLLRQYFFSNLHDRLTTRPFLSLIEKKWLAFQLLWALKQSHENGVCHGDIKCENVLVTSWNWLYLVDFASFKPTYIPDDDPSDFSFFFDTGGRRRCYVAPERFYEHGCEMQVASDTMLKPSMDIFSLGCVIAELFLEGQPLFELSQLLAYRRGQHDPSQHLEKIQDAGIQKMILHMIQLDPEARLSCESYLQRYASSIFPDYFSPFLHKLFSCLIPLDSDTRVAVTQNAFGEVHKQMIGTALTEGGGSKQCTDSNKMIGGSALTKCRKKINNTAASIQSKEELGNSMSDGQYKLVGDIVSLLKEIKQRNHCLNSKETLDITALASKSSDSIYSIDACQHAKYGSQKSSSELLETIVQIYKEKENPLLEQMLHGDLNSLTERHYNQSEIYGILFFPGMQINLSCEGMVLIASLLCSCIRNVKQPQLRRTGVLLLKASSLYIDDDDRLQHVLPYVIAMLSDPAAIVRSAALETLCDILPLVQDFPPSEAKIFPEYVLPMLSMLPDDPEESVRIVYAKNIFKIAVTAYRILIQSQNPNRSKQCEKTQSVTTSQRKKLDDNIDTQLSQLRKSIAAVVQELVMGTKQTPNIRRALLHDIGHLCCFFGHRQSNDFLLPLLPAFLNDRDEQLRAAFYRQIIFVCYFVGPRSVEEYLLPYIEQALSDSVEAVIVNALECLTLLSRSGLLRKRVLIDILERAFPLSCHPIQWVRKCAVTFIATCSENLGPVDSYVYISPGLHPFLTREPSSFSSQESLFLCLKPPVSKLAFHQVLENSRCSDMLERQRKIWYNSSVNLKQWETIECSQKLAVGLDTVKISGTKHSDTQGIEVLKLRSANSFCAPTTNSLSSEKPHASGYISPFVTSGNSFHCDGQSEDIPVYSFCSDKRRLGVAAGTNASLYVNSLGICSSSIPFFGPVDKPFGLSSSLPLKHPSASFTTRQVSKAAKNADSLDNDQSSRFNSKSYEISMAETLKGENSLVGDDALQPEASEYARGPSVPDTGWRPRGVLVAHLEEHRSSVNDIAISSDNSFFVTASSDSTVKIWDTKKLEKDISFQSRLTYHLDGGKALCTSMLHGTAQAVVGASDGILHLFSVDHISRGLGSVVERYNRIAEIKKKDVGEGAILSLLNCSAAEGFSSHTVLYSTEGCGIHLWDIRATSEAWMSRASPGEGCISSLVMGQCGNWFVSGSSRGVLTLWDMRFLLPVNSWQYSSVCPVEKMCLLIPPANSMMTIARPYIYIAAGCNEVSLWNAENGSCHQVFRTESGDNDPATSNVPWALAQPSKKPGPRRDSRRILNSSKYRFDEVDEPPQRFPGIRSLLPLPRGDLLTGGTDLKIRYWDYTSPGMSYSVCGPSEKANECSAKFDVRSSSGVQVVQEIRGLGETKFSQKASRQSIQKGSAYIATTDPAGCHRDTVLSLSLIKISQRLLISSSRDGSIKVWK